MTISFQVIHFFILDTFHPDTLYNQLYTLAALSLERLCYMPLSKEIKWATNGIERLPSC
jgi:hypothetical protein